MANAEKFCEHVFRTFDKDRNGQIGKIVKFSVSVYYCLIDVIEVQLDVLITLYQRDRTKEVLEHLNLI